jgi:hypothetical protein
MSKTAVKPPVDKLYETDFYAWTQQQAKLLRAGRWKDLDLENLIEEIESVGRKENNEIRSRMVVILAHLLKWRYQPGRQGASWRRTLFEQRARLAQIIEDSPGLRDQTRRALDLAYSGATSLAERETGIDVTVFPEKCPFTVEQVLDQEYYPPDLGLDDQSGMR